MFQQYGYDYIDVRKYFQADGGVEQWYRENMILFVKSDKEKIAESIESLWRKNKLGWN